MVSIAVARENKSTPSVNKALFLKMYNSHEKKRAWKEHKILLQNQLFIDFSFFWQNYIFF